MIEKEWYFSGTTVYVYDNGSIVLKTFGTPLKVFVMRKGKTCNRMLTLTFELQQEFQFTQRQAWTF